VRGGDDEEGETRKDIQPIYQYLIQCDRTGYDPI
jgi:hypothetical protein